MGLLTSVASTPLPRDADHYFNTKELWARGRALFKPADLPRALRLQAEEVVEQPNNQVLSTVLEDNTDDDDTLGVIKTISSTTTKPTTTTTTSSSSDTNLQQIDVISAPTTIQKKIKKTKKMKIVKEKKK